VERRKAAKSGRRRSGELEADVLAVLWASEVPLTPKQVQKKLDRPLAYTTVATILVRLGEKGMVERTRTPRGYTYRAVIEEGEHITEEFRRLLARAGDHTVALRSLVDGLSPDDELELLRMLTEGRPAAGSDAE
jgi:predicted transcriptional regulator